MVYRHLDAVKLCTFTYYFCRSFRQKTQESLNISISIDHVKSIHIVSTYLSFTDWLFLQGVA